MIIYLEVECLFYDSHSLKQKRSVIKRLKTRIRNEFNVSVTELDYHDLWQRTKLGIVTISTDKVRGEQIIQSVIKHIDGYTELERTLTAVEER